VKRASALPIGGGESQGRDPWRRRRAYDSERTEVLAMILVHRLRGEPMFLNEDLIESIESTPDTVVTLVDGRKLVLADAPRELVERTRGYRWSVLAAVEDLRATARAEVHLLADRRTRRAKDES